MVGALVNSSRHYGRKRARARCCSLDTGWLLILVLYPGCTAIENNRPIKPLRMCRPARLKRMTRLSGHQMPKELCSARTWATLSFFNGVSTILQQSISSTALPLRMDLGSKQEVFSRCCQNGRCQDRRYAQREINGPLLQGRGDRSKGLVIEFYEPICVPQIRALSSR